ncbi:cycloeucalenol cycloisomerase-like isoform X1 [Raphanus sativus]|uniref:Cycloeucalenol cycloisomerase-like isoform X1 n=1 Tax=Raphanus sativus TaxID=3726 RepID=A0A9W3BWW5_RAPSA|nr:cycloeucalenol cycloisomerase-like isoform X1 [Raphanus sativus]
MSGSSDVSRSLWLAQNPSKRWGELFFLFYTPFWLTLFLGIIVPYKLYETFTELEYLLVALVSAVPAFLIPMLVIGKADRGLCWKDRYWVKANLWIIIFSYVGNYFLTHYFFQVLGASYTFPSWKMNNVPHNTFSSWHMFVSSFTTLHPTLLFEGYDILLRFDTTCGGIRGSSDTTCRVNRNSNKTSLEIHNIPWSL